MSKPQDHNLADSLLLSGRVVKRTNNTLTTGVPQGLHILQVGPRRKIGFDYIYGLVASTMTDVERKNMASQGVGTATTATDPPKSGNKRVADEATGIVLEIATIGTGPPKPNNKRASDEAADMSPLP